MAVGITIDTRAFDALNVAISRMGQVNTNELLDLIGSEVASQTKRRIESERTSPEGKPWAPWSPDYARTRHAGHNLLQDEGHLYQTMQHVVQGDTVLTGSNRDYAVWNQASRPFLGLSPENIDDVNHLINLWLDDQVTGALR